MRIRHAPYALVAIATFALLTSCGDDDPNADATGTPEPAPTATADPTPTEDPDAAAVPEVEAAYERYWDVVVTSENTLDESYEDLKTVMNEPIAQRQVADVRGLREDNVTRDGAPDIGRPQVTVDGDTARVESCVDETDWHVYYNDELVEQDTGVQPRVFDFERVDGEWIVVEYVEQTEATITC